MLKLLRPGPSLINLFVVQRFMSTEELTGAQRKSQYATLPPLFHCSLTKENPTAVTSSLKLSIVV